MIAIYGRRNIAGLTVAGVFVLAVLAHMIHPNAVQSDADPSITRAMAPAQAGYLSETHPR